MRKAKFKKWIPAQYEEKNENDFLPKQKEGTGCFSEDFSENGLFHQWGTACEESHENYGNYTVGIIELEDGSICTAHPEHIKFMDKYA